MATQVKTGNARRNPPSDDSQASQNPFSHRSHKRTTLVFRAPPEQNYTFLTGLLRHWVAPELARKFLELRCTASGSQDPENRETDYRTPLQAQNSGEECASGGA